jgi:phospholipid N-methyltransferase
LVFGYVDPFYDAWDAPSRRRRGAGKITSSSSQLTHSVTHVLVLHKNESVELGAAVGVFETAGVAANVALRLVP